MHHERVEGVAPGGGTRLLVAGWKSLEDVVGRPCLPVQQKGVAVTVGALEAVVERALRAARGLAQLLDREGLWAAGTQELEAELEPIGLGARGDG